MAKRATKKPEKQVIRVFIASPGDLAVERRAFKEVIDELNDGFADGAGITFEALRWENTLATTGRRVQGVINLDVDHCDIFVLVMHRRWGQDAPDTEPYLSYTEEEFHRAYDRWKRTKSPEIFIFFKHIDPGHMADPGTQLQKVLAFRKSLEESRHVLYRGFADEIEFKAEVNQHLRAFAKDELPKPDAITDSVLLPLAAIEAIKKERIEKQRAVDRAENANQQAEAASARAELLALQFAERASEAALEGRVEQARQDFAKATDGTTNIQVLFLAFQFFYRTADLVTAEEMLERWIAISGRSAETADTAGVLGNLGLIYSRRGELDRAEEMHQKAREISEKLGIQEGIASVYRNLGVIYGRRGDLERAEDMHLKSLAINGNLSRQGEIAGDYCNLGAIYIRRGNLDKAEEIIRNALMIDEKLDRQEGMSSNYCNLGLIYRRRGETDKAEMLHLKALSIDQKLDRQEEMAGNYSNLGLIYRIRGELDRAEEMYRKSLAIDEKLGHQEGMAIDCSNLGLIYGTRGDLNSADEMYQKSLKINQKLSRQEGMANDYRNLGLIHRRRGDLDKAKELWTKARDIFIKTGITPKATEVQEMLDGL